MKKMSNISVDDLSQRPVWEFVSGSGDKDSSLKPIEMLPVDDLSNRFVGTKVALRNGHTLWAILANISLTSRRASEQFLTLSIEKNGRWFDLARYHDIDFTRRGPQQLATYLGLKVSEVFPIKYDISAVARGHPDIVVGEIPLQPKEYLSQDQLIELSLE